MTKSDCPMSSITVTPRSVLNGTIKLVLMAAFYIAGALSANQVSLFTIDTQKSRISELETETETQRVEIDILTRKVAENSNNLATISEIRRELTAIREEIKTLKGLHNK